MRDIINEVYESLKKSTAALTDKRNKCKALEKELNNNVFSEIYKKDTLRPKLDKLKASITADKKAAIDEVKALIKEYQGELYDLDNLHPEDMTEDAKLFTSGVRLNRRDLEAILSRNKDNNTMEQMVYRYAEEHGVDMGGKTYHNHSIQIQEAESLSNSLETIAHWIDTDKGEEFIERVFTGTANRTEPKLDRNIERTPWAEMEVIRL